MSAGAGTVVPSFFAISRWALTACSRAVAARWAWPSAAAASDSHIQPTTTSPSSVDRAPSCRTSWASCSACANSPLTMRIGTSDWYAWASRRGLLTSRPDFAASSNRRMPSSIWPLFIARSAALISTQ